MTFKEWDTQNELLEYDPTPEEVWNAAIDAAFRIARDIEYQEWAYVGDPRIKEPILNISEAIRELRV